MRSFNKKMRSFNKKEEKNGRWLRSREVALWQKKCILGSWGGDEKSKVGFSHSLSLDTTTPTQRAGTPSDPTT